MADFTGSPQQVVAFVKPTYRFAVANFSPVATPTAFLVMASGANNAQIKRIKVSGVATATGNMQIQMARWSTAGTQGSAVLTALTGVTHDIKDPTPTTVVSTVGTANYTTQGTGSTIPMAVDRIQMSAAGSGLGVPMLAWDFGVRLDKGLILRGGSTDIIVLSGNGSAVPAGGAIDIEVEIEEQLP